MRDKNLLASWRSLFLKNKIPATMKFCANPEIIKKLTGFKLKKSSAIINCSLS
jgi:hypothetical protein